MRIHTRAEMMSGEAHTTCVEPLSLSIYLTEGERYIERESVQTFSLRNPTIGGIHMGLFDGWTARASKEIADWIREPAGKVESNLPSVYTIADDPAMREHWADWKNPASLEPERYKLGEWEMLRMLGISPERTFDTPHAYAEPLHLLPHMHEVRVTARTERKHFPTCGITREEWLALTDGGRLSLTQIYTEPEEDLRYEEHLSDVVDEDDPEYWDTYGGSDSYSWEEAV